MILRQVPLNPQIWQQYAGFWTFRGPGLQAPPAPRQGYWVVTDSGALVAGVCIYNTDSIFLIAEGLATNPQAPLKMRYAAVQFLINAVLSDATSRGMVVVAMPRVPSVARTLQKRGFQIQPGVIMTSAPGMTIGEM